MAPQSKSSWGLILLIKYLPLQKIRKFRQNRRKTIISRDICKKLNIAPNQNSFWDELFSETSSPFRKPDNFVKIAV